MEKDFMLGFKEIFDAISQVSDGLTLVAFLAALGSYVYLKRNDNNSKLIKSVPDEQKAKIAEGIISDIISDPKLLPDEDKIKFALAELKSRHKKRVLVVISAIVFGFFFLIISLISIENEKTIGNPTIAGNVVEDGTGKPIENAKITVIGYNFQTMSDRNGDYLGKLGTKITLGETVRLVVTKDGYERFSDLAPINSQTVGIDITLKPIASN